MRTNGEGGQIFGLFKCTYFSYDPYTKFPVYIALDVRTSQLLHLKLFAELIKQMFLKGKIEVATFI